MSRRFHACSIAVAAFLATPALAISPQDVVGTWKLISNVRQAGGSETVENNLVPGITID